MLNIGNIFGTLSLEDKFTKVLNDAVKKTEVASKSIKDSAKKAEKFQAAFGGMRDIGASMLPISAAITGVAVASIKFATDFNKSMANVSTLIPGNITRVNQLKEGIQDLAKDTGKSTKDLSDGMYQVISAFGDSSESMKRLEINAKAAAAGMATTTDAINLTSAVTKGYGDVSAEAMAKASDLAFMTVKLGQTTFPELASSIGAVVPIASALKVKQEELFTGFATLTGVTGNAAEVSTQLKSVMTAMLSPSKEMVEAMNRIGVESVDAMIQQYGLVGSMQKLIESTDGSKEAIGELFPNVRALPAVFALSGGQAETFAQKLGKMKDAAGATNEAYKEITEGVNKVGHEFEKAKQQITVALQKLGDSLLPIAASIGQNFVLPLIAALDKLVWAFSDLPTPLKLVVIALASVVTAIGPLLFVFGTIVPKIMAARTALIAFSGASKLVTLSLTTLGWTLAIVAAGVAAYSLTRIIMECTGAQEAINSLIDAHTGLTESIDQINRRNAKLMDFRKSLEKIDLPDLENFLNPKNISKYADKLGVYESQIASIINAVIRAKKVQQEYGTTNADTIKKINDLRNALSGANLSQRMAEMSKAIGGGLKMIPSKVQETVALVQEALAVGLKPPENLMQVYRAEMGKQIKELAQELAGASEKANFSKTISALNYLGDASKVSKDKLEELAETLKKGEEAGRKLSPIAKEVVERFNALQIKNLADQFKGLEKGKELAKVVAAVNTLGSASEVAESEIGQLAEQLKEAASKDEDIGKLGQEIIDLAAKIEKVNQAWSDAEGERKRQADLIGGYYSEVEQGYLDIESAISQATKGTMDYGKLSDAQLQRVAAKLQQLSVEATAGKYSIDGLDDQLRAAFLEIQKRMPENSWLAEFFKQVTHGEIRKGWLKVSDYINTARDAITAFGFSADSAFAQALSGASSFAQGMADIRTATTPLGQIQAGVSIAQGAVQVLDSVFGGKENWEKVAEEIGNTFGTSISDSLAQTISDTSAQVAGFPAQIVGTFMEGVIDESDRYTASIIHLGDIMAEGLEDGFTSVGQYKEGIHDLFVAIEDGTLTTQQGLESLGDVWDQLAEQSERGDAQARQMMVQMMQTASATGNIPIQMAEAMEGGVDQMISGLEMVLGGLQNVGEAQGELFASAFWAAVGTKGLLAASDALKESWEQLPEEILAGLGDVARLMDLTQLNEAFRGAAEVGQGLADMVEGMGAANLITAESFQNLGQTALEAFEQAIAGGASEAEAITAILPYLAQAKQMAELYGIELDENTQRLIEQAEQAGYAFPAEPQQVMIDLLREIVTVLGGEIPESAQIAAESMSQASEKISEDAGKAADGITSKMSQVPEELASLFNGLPESFDQLSGSAIDAFQKLAEKSGQSVDSIWAKLQELQNKKLQIELEISTKTGSSGSGGKVKGKVTPMAEGGIVTRPTFGLMGEAGPEAIIPLSELGMIQNNNNTAEMRQMMKDQTDILTNTLVKIMRDSLLQAQ